MCICSALRVRMFTLNPADYPASTKMCRRMFLDIVASDLFFSGSFVFDKTLLFESS